MSKIKVQNKMLAALREYRKGMDVEEFMSTEFKQVIRALQNMFVETGGGFDFTGIRTPVFKVGVVYISDFVIRVGTFKSNIFRPESSGRYWVQFGMEMTPVAAGTVLNSLIAKYEDGTVVHTLPASVINGQGVKYVEGKCYMDLDPSRGAYFEFTGDSNTSGTNFHCSFIKVN